MPWFCHDRFMSFTTIGDSRRTCHSPTTRVYRPKSTAMAWGKTVGVASWVDRLKADDQTLTSVTVFRGRLFGPSEAAEVCDALRSNTALREFYASGHAVDVETAGKFADMLTVNKTIQYICIGDASFGDEGVAALARGIASSASLRAVDLENKGMGDEGARALGAALGESKVTELNISHNDALTDAGLAAVCLGAAAGRTVTSLRVAGLSVGPESCAAVSKLLASSGGALRRLDATDAKMDPGGIMALGVALRDDGGERSGSLDELVLDGTRLGDDGAAALAGARGRGGGEGDARGGMGVLSLSIQGCEIGEAGVSAIASTPRAPGGVLLETLNLRGNKAGDAGATAIAAAIAGEGPTGGESAFSALKTIDVGANGLGAAGAVELIRHSGPVENMSLFGNEAVGDDGAVAMVGAVQTGAGGRGLRILDIGGCGIGEVGMLALCDGLIDHPTDVFPALETLVVGGNPGAVGDAWEAALERLRQARSTLDVAWRAADAGDSQDQDQQKNELLDQYKQQQQELPPPSTP